MTGFVQDVVSYLEPHVRAFQRSGTNSEAHSRSLMRGCDLERLTSSGQNSDDPSSSIQFMTMPLRTAGVSTSVSGSSTEVDFSNMA